MTNIVTAAESGGFKCKETHYPISKRFGLVTRPKSGGTKVSGSFVNYAAQKRFYLDRFCKKYPDIDWKQDVGAAANRLRNTFQRIDQQAETPVCIAPPAKELESFGGTMSWEEYLRVTDHARLYQCKGGEVFDQSKATGRRRAQSARAKKRFSGDLKTYLLDVDVSAQLKELPPSTRTTEGLLEFALKYFGGRTQAMQLSVSEELVNCFMASDAKNPWETKGGLERPPRMIVASDSRLVWINGMGLAMDIAGEIAEAAGDFDGDGDSDAETDDGEAIEAALEDKEVCEIMGADPNHKKRRRSSAAASSASSVSSALSSAGDGDSHDSPSPRKVKLF